jgi:hypothetical protein
MKGLFDSYAPEAHIPVQDYLKNRKLAKYFNKETAAAVVCAAKLLQANPVAPETPFYYETGLMEFEDLGLDRIAESSKDPQGRFSQQLFVEKGITAVPPITQFKALYNMPLSFISIEFNLVGDNAVIYSSTRGLLTQILFAPQDKGILIGCGKAFRDGHVETGFALVDKEEIQGLAYADSDQEAISLFRAWAREGVLK